MTTDEAEVAAVAEPVAEPQPGPGDAAPDITLKPAKGKALDLQSLWQEKPLVLAFCGQPATAASIEQVLLLRDAKETFELAGAAVACIIACPWQDAGDYVRQYNLWFPLFCDDGHAHEAFSVAPELPASFVIDTSGTVRYAHRGAVPFDQASTFDLAEAVCAITGAHVERPELVEPVPVYDTSWAGSALTQKAAAIPGQYQCAKCGNASCETSPLSTSGGWLSRIFNYEYRTFHAVSCTSCGYSELYRSRAGALANAADIVLGG